MTKNVFVLGLDEGNLDALHEMPRAADCRFHPLLDLDQLRDGIDVPALLADARRQLAAFDGTADDVARVEREVPGATVQLIVDAGQRLSGLTGQDSYSYELAVVYLGAPDELELVRRYQRCVDLLPFEFTDEAGEEG